MNGSSLETPRLFSVFFMEVFTGVEWAMGGLLLNFYAVLPANISFFYRLPKTIIFSRSEL